jgi:hypothetical protein
MVDELQRKPRRRIEFIAKIGADSWKDLQHELSHLATEIARHGRLSASSCSGGYSAGHIVVTSENGDITHDSWAKELDDYLEALDRSESAAAGVTVIGDAREGGAT